MCLCVYVLLVTHFCIILLRIFELAYGCTLSLGGDEMRKRERRKKSAAKMKKKKKKRMKTKRTTLKKAYTRIYAIKIDLIEWEKEIERERE